MELYSKSLLLALALLASVFAAARSFSVGWDSRALTFDGKRRLIISGAIHYPRSTPEMWPDLLKKAKQGGLDAIETYVFWNGHEPRRGEYNFEGNYNLIRFLKEIRDAGLYAVLRIGPYVCAEWNYGGVPAWLRTIPGLQFRTNNGPFETEMLKFTTLIVNMVKEANLLAPQGGPIILTQIENEYGNIEWAYYNEGKQYVNWCAEMANSLKVGVPWIMCQQDDAPSSVLNTCNGFYCDGWYPRRNTIPKMWTENWTGWFKAWDKPDPHRPVEDVAFAVARFFQRQGTFQNYYMYHGGTNFGRTSGGPYITTSYDYDAPLDECGAIRQPKWGHLKELHAVLKAMENVIVYGERTEATYGDISTTKYTLDGASGCFLSNINAGTDLNVTFEGSTYLVPAWSVSLLPDCTTVAYNTAKVKTQTSVMVKKPSMVEAEPAALRWSWTPENLRPFFTDEDDSFRTKELLDQITTGVDQSDYLWYLTSIDHDSVEKFTLYVNTTGHALYAFVNGELVGQKHSPDWPFNFELEAPVKLQTGKNYISLLSATTGLKNYGDHYELMPAGIVGGPVKLIGANNFAIDLSHNTWSYKTGLEGEIQEVHLDKPGVQWQSGVIPTKRPFTWYKGTFEAPTGFEPVVVDLLGLGKGMAWVNGNSLGRYWPTYPANWMDGCYWCDYRGTFGSDQRCLSGCGEPSQRWYHVPRSFLKTGERNTIVLFEEAGGSPLQVNFQTVGIGSMCVSVERGDSFTLSCQYGKYISSIDFANLGSDVHGKCGSYQGGCSSKPAYSILSEACVGKESCNLQYTDLFLDGDCSNAPSNTLTVQATCAF